MCLVLTPVENKHILHQSHTTGIISYMADLFVFQPVRNKNVTSPRLGLVFDGGRVVHRKGAFLVGVFFVFSSGIQV